MPEPTLIATAAQSAAKAVGGLVVRASAPEAKKAFARLRPAPSAVRKSSGWAETKRVRAEQEAIGKYLGGRLCLGLLEILAVLELASDGVDRSVEKQELAETFTRELGKKLKLPDDQAASVGKAIWSDLHDLVRLQVTELRAEGAFADEDLAYVTSLSAQVDGPRPMMRTVADRTAVSEDYQRVRLAHAAAQIIRQSARARYAKLVMPHSREDYLVPIEKLYVKRTLRPTAAPDVGVPEHEVAERRFVVIGNPGAGKSTFVRHLLFHTAGASGEEDGIAPLVVELKDHQQPPDSFVTVLTEQLNRVTQADLSVDSVRDLLLLGMAVVVFDGLDEVSDIDQRRLTVEAINAFARQYPLVRVVTTAREEGYFAARLDPAMFPVFSLPDFSNDQVELYVRQWFRIAADWSGSTDADTMAQRFIDDSVHIGDLRTNPLMLSLLCLIYKYEGYIPENRPDVYEECAELLFERWDLMRRVPIAISRDSKTKYLVQELGYYFFNRERTLGGETESRLRAIVTDYFERNIVGGVESARQKAQAFLDYCAGRAWLLTHVGTNEKGERLFGFTHRTFMEYYAARFIVRRCRDATYLVGMIRPMLVMGTSEVVPQIAIQQFDDKNDRGADDCFALLVLDRADASTADQRRILDFCLRSLRYMRPSARTLSQLFMVALGEFGRTLDVTIAMMLLNAPDDTHDLLRSDCLRAMAGLAQPRPQPTRELPASDDFGPLGSTSAPEPTREASPDMTTRRIGATVMFVLLEARTATRTARDIAEQLLISSNALAEYLEAGLPAVARTQIAVVTELNQRDLFSTEKYVEIFGERALISVPTIEDDVLHEVPGRLVSRLVDFFIRETEHSDLRPMLSSVYQKPSAVAPMNPQVVSAILESAGPLSLGEGATLEGIGNFNDRVIEQHFPARHPADDALGLRMVYLAAVCAAFDYEYIVVAAMRTERSWREIALALPGLSQLVTGAWQVDLDGGIALSREELAKCVLTFCGKLKVSEHWKRLFALWRDNPAVLCVYKSTQ